MNCGKSWDLIGISPHDMYDQLISVDVMILPVLFVWKYFPSRVWKVLGLSFKCKKFTSIVKFIFSATIKEGLIIAI